MNRSAVPVVSLGLPVFNGENFLVDALDSVFAQSFSDFELIIMIGEYSVLDTPPSDNRRLGLARRRHRMLTAR